MSPLLTGGADARAAAVYQRRATTMDKQSEFDKGQYPVVLSERLKDMKKAGYTMTSLQVDPKLDAPKDIQSAKLVPSKTTQGGVNLKLKDAKNDRTTLTGETQPTPDRLVLLWDPQAQHFVLDLIDNEVHFDPETHSSQPQAESPEPSSSSSSSPPSADEGDAREALIREAGEPDADNPYDWRHQLRRRTSPPVLSDRDLSPSPPPAAARPSARARKPRQASTPPEYGGTPTIQLPDAPPPATDDDSDEADDEDDEGGLFGGGGGGSGGLQIVMDGAAEPAPRRRGRADVWGRPKPAGEPISLRSAATSRSPALAVARASEDPEDDLEEEDLNEAQPDGLRGGGSNADVEEMRLGSPMHDRPAPEPTDVAMPEDDADDDMAADFEQALQGDAGEEPAQHESEEQEEVSLVAQPESSSESEEE